jgi:predicted Fe-Mo cluster-binding NifX family protein
MGPGARNILEAMDIEIVLVQLDKTVKELVEEYLGSL